jgi:hypothetical protein
MQDSHAAGWIGMWFASVSRNKSFQHLPLTNKCYRLPHWWDHMLDCYSMPFSTNKIDWRQKQWHSIGIQISSVGQFCECLANNHSRKSEIWRREWIVWHWRFINIWQTTRTLFWDINSGFPDSVIGSQSSAWDEFQKNSWVLSVRLNIKIGNTASIWWTVIIC